MSFTQHLEELRSTMIKVLIILSVSFVVAYSLGDKISEFLLTPLREALGTGNGKIVYIGILDKVLSQFQVAFWSAIIISAPLWFYQLWKFIKPGLHNYEIKAVRPFLFFGLILFSLGVAFGQFVVFPLTFQTLLDFGVGDVEATIGLKDYLVLSCKVLVFLGIVFQLPNILLILGFMGIVTKYSLNSMRRYVYVGLAAFSAVLTPPDVLTMLGLWFPMVVLFEVGVIAVALIVHPYLKKVHT